MVKEELFIIVEGVRKQIDIPSPSGITLNYVSNLFNDLSKINASYTYTFKLPRTANNVRVLELADDVRANSKFTRVKGDAEFLRNGVPLFSKCNLYVNAVTADSIECNFTWNVLEGLDSLQKYDVPLTELEGTAYEWQSDYDATHEKDDLVEIGYDLEGAGFDEYLPQNLTKSIAYPYYVAGIDPDDNLPYSWEVVAPLYRDKEYVLTQAPYNISASPTFSTEDSHNVHPIPAPVIKVSHIVENISHRYGIDFAFRGDLYEKLYMPLVSMDKSEGLLRQISVETSLGAMQLKFAGADNVIAIPYFPSDATSIISSIGTTDHVELCPIRDEDFPSTVLGYALKSTNHSAFKLVLDGYVQLEFNPPIGATYGSPHLEVRTMVDYVRLDDEDAEPHSPYQNKFSDESLASAPFHMNTPEYTGYRCDFRREYGFDNLETDYHNFTDHPVCFALYIDNMSKDDIIRYVHNVDLSHLKVYISYGTGDVGYHANLYKNLPDISCLEFIKSLYYILGGFPFVDYDGNVGIKFYSDITKNFACHNILDWSHKILKRKDDVDVNFSCEAFSSLAQNNYYLMSNDEVDSFGKEYDYEYGKDRYAHSYMNVKVQSEILPKTNTVIKLPFTGKFIANKSLSKWYTGETTDLWKVSFDKEYLFELHRTSINKATPAIGTLTLQETWHNESEIVPEYDDPEDDRPTGYATVYRYRRGTMLTGFKVWQFPKDIASDLVYAPLYAVLSSPYEIVEEMNLSEIDLLRLDYTVPVYLEKYNSYFVVSKIESNTESLSKVYLLKIDMDYIDVEGYKKSLSEPELIIRGDLIYHLNLSEPYQSSSAYRSMYGITRNTGVRIYEYEGTSIYLPNFTANIYVFYGGKQVRPDQISQEVYANGQLVTTDRVPLNAPLTITHKVTASYKNSVVTWMRSVTFDVIQNASGNILNWGLACNRPYSLVYINNNDTVRASELGVAYIEPDVRIFRPSTGYRNGSYCTVQIEGGISQQNDYMYGKLTPKRNCRVSVYAYAYNGASDLEGTITFNYVYDIDDAETESIMVGEAVWQSPRMNSDSPEHDSSVLPPTVEPDEPDEPEPSEGENNNNGNNDEPEPSAG